MKYWTKKGWLYLEVIRKVILIRNKPNLHLLSTHTFTYATTKLVSSTRPRHLVALFVLNMKLLELGGDVPEFVMNVTGTFHNDALLRQITEAAMISKVLETDLINSKSEWNYAHIPRTDVIE